MKLEPIILENREKRRRFSWASELWRKVQDIKCCVVGVHRSHAKSFYRNRYSNWFICGILDVFNRRYCCICPSSSKIFSSALVNIRSQRANFCENAGVQQQNKYRVVQISWILFSHRKRAIFRSLSTLLNKQQNGRILSDENRKSRLPITFVNRSVRAD